MNTLFWDTSTAITGFKSYDMIASAEFIDCADKQLTEVFTKKTGIKAGKNACFSISTGGSDNKLPYIKDVISTVSLRLYINHNWNPITIVWKAKSGRIYNIDDTDIDCSDIKFSFDHLDTALYLGQFFPNQKLPFKTDNLSFELVVTHLNIDCTLILTINEKTRQNAADMIQQLDWFFGNWNETSEKKNRNDGVVHSAKGSIENDQTIIYEMDLGSAAGPTFFKQLLRFLSKTNCFTKVEIA